MLRVGLGLLLVAGTSMASTVTVLGSMEGRIWYDGKDVGTIPLRLTAVPAGRHVVRIRTAAGLDRTFDLNYPAGQNTDRVVDMDVELSRREPEVQPAPLTAQRPYRDEVRYEPVYPSGSDYYRNYDARDYRSNYGPYPSGYGQPYYGGNYYGYGPGYYDNYGGVFNSQLSRGFRNHDRDQQRSAVTAPVFSPPVTPLAPVAPIIPVAPIAPIAPATSGFSGAPVQPFVQTQPFDTGRTVPFAPTGRLPSPRPKLLGEP